LGEDAAVDSLLAKLDERSDEFATKARAIGLDRCTDEAGGSGGGTATTMARGGDQALLAEGKAAFQSYIDAIYSADPEREAELSTMWAGQYAQLRRIQAVTAAATKAEPVEGRLNLDAISGIVDEDGIWILQGQAVLTLPDITHTFTDITLAENEAGDLVVADYCRTNPKEQGPLNGCLSGSAGKVAQKSTSPDGSVVVTLSPVFRTQGFGEEAMLIGVVIDNTAGTVPARLRGGPLATTMRSASGEDVTVPSTSAESVDVAPPGGKATGILRLNQPGTLSDPTSPAATLKLSVEQEGVGPFTTGTFEIPALPQDPSAF
jgi:hypothetical protein